MKYHFLLILLVVVMASCKNKSTEKSAIQPTKENIDSLLNLYPDSVPLLLFRGNLAIDEYRFFDALADGARAFRLDSNNLKVRMLYAESLNNKANRTMDEVANAQRHYKYIVFNEPKNTDALVSLAATYRHM